MRKIENALARRLNEERSVPYPDFEGMWDRMEQAGQTSPAWTAVTESGGGKRERQEQSGQLSQAWMKSTESAAPRRRRNWRTVSIAASLSALLFAVPVYAAIQYDWGNLLRYRSGVQTALGQNLGQPLEQSVTRDGVTLSLHTAVVDENRTVILYSLDVGKRILDQHWKVDKFTLKSADGKDAEEWPSSLQWDEKTGRYNSYLESDWTPQGDTAEVQLVATDVTARSIQQLDLPLDISSSKPQSFPIERDGMSKIEVQVLGQGEEKLLFSSAVTFDRPELKEGAVLELSAYRDGERVQAQSGGTFGTPGDKGEYTAEQYFKTSDLSKGQTEYKLEYVKEEKRVAESFAFDLQLSKKQMEGGTIKTALNQPLEAGDNVNTFESMVVTPTQIRVSIRSKDKKFSGTMPYQKYVLEVNGQSLEGGRWYSDDRQLTTIRFERPANLEITEQTPITFVGKYKVTIHEEDKEPLLLTNISEKKQTLIRETGGYPVKWTYYMQGNNLTVETASDDARFGGVNQTHIGLGKKRIIGKKVTYNFSGDGNNKGIDVYKDFKGTEASIYMFYYSINAPEQETRVLLQPLSEKTSEAASAEQ